MDQCFHFSLGKDSDHIVAFRWSDPFPGMLLTVDTILHKEVPFLLEVCSTVTTHIAFRVNMLIAELYEYTSGEKNSTTIKVQEDDVS